MKNGMDRQRITNTLLLIIVIFIVGLVLKLVQHVITPLLISLLLASLMDTVMVFLRRFRIPLALAYLLTIVFFLGAFLGIGYLVIRNLREFQLEFPKYEYRLLDLIQRGQRQLRVALSADVPFDPIGALKKLPLGSIALHSVQSLLRGLLDFSLIFFFAVLILLGKHQYVRKILKVFPRSRASRVPITLTHIDRNVRKYLAVKTFVSLLAATLETIVLLLFHVKFAVIFGLLTFLLNFIPSVGAIIATVLPTLFAFAQYTDPLMVLWVFVSITMIHMVIGNFLDPTLMGETLNLSLLVVFVSLFFWGWLWGPLGILLAVPMTVTIKIILQNIESTAPYAVFLEKARPHRIFHPRKADEPPDDTPDSDADDDPIVDKRVSQSL